MSREIQFKSLLESSKIPLELRTNYGLCELCYLTIDSIHYSLFDLHLDDLVHSEYPSILLMYFRIFNLNIDSKIKTNIHLTFNGKDICKYSLTEISNYVKLNLKNNQDIATKLKTE